MAYGDIYRYFRLYVTCLRACAALACLARGFRTGWAVVGRELRVIVSHVTRENSRCVRRMQLFVDNVKVYEAHDFELESAQYRQGSRTL